MSEAVRVCRVGDNTLRTETVPVVFVPGVMGSRLEIGDDDSWDPDSNMNMMGWAFASVETARTSFSLDTPGKVLETGDDVPDDRQDRGWAGVSWRFYGDFLEDLDEQRFGALSTPAYAVGYDWRQSNRDSGKYVAKEIGKILDATGATRYILVSHSMGGLVTRAMLKDDAGIAGKAMGVVHIAQPALGAAVFYRRMFTGAEAGPDGGALSPSGIVLRNIMGTSRESFQTILSAMPGPMQLMVTPRYRDTGGRPWLSITPFEAPVRREVEAVAWDDYRGPESPPGFLVPVGQRHALPAARDADMRQRITDAQTFHDWLQDYKHPKTWAIYGDGLETDMGAHFDLPPRNDRDYRMIGGYGMGMGMGMGGAPPTWYAQRSDGRSFHYRTPNPADRGFDLVRRDEGDGTVPAPSAQALFPGQAHAVAEHVTDYAEKRQFRVTGGGAVHDAICHHPDAEKCLFDIMRHVLGGGQ